MQLEEAMSDTRLSEEELGSLKKQELMVLHTFKDICEKHQLTYFITAGTLLGAVRHRGFIPWDDDIDVIMPRKDYNRFARLCEKDLPEGLFLQNKRTDSEYPFHFSKLRIDGTSVYDPFLSGVAIHKGIYIDIFPVDKCPLDDRFARLMFKWVGMTTYALIAKSDASFDFDFTKKTARLAYRFLRWLPRRMVTALRDGYVALGNLFCSGKKLCTVSGAHGFPRETYDASWHAGSTQMWFEDDEFPAPVGWDEQLTRMYGDYMTPPEKEDRDGHFYKKREEE